MKRSLRFIATLALGVGLGVGAIAFLSDSDGSRIEVRGEALGDADDAFAKPCSAENRTLTRGVVVTMRNNTGSVVATTALRAGALFNFTPAYNPEPVAAGEPGWLDALHSATDATADCRLRFTFAVVEDSPSYTVKIEGFRAFGFMRDELAREDYKITVDLR